MLNLSNRAEIGTEIATWGGLDTLIFSIMGILLNGCFPYNQIFFGCNYNLSDTRVSDHTETRVLNMLTPGCQV